MGVSESTDVTHSAAAGPEKEGTEGQKNRQAGEGRKRGKERGRKKRVLKHISILRLRPKNEKN